MQDEANMESAVLLLKGVVIQDEEDKRALPKIRIIPVEVDYTPSRYPTPLSMTGTKF